MSEWQEYLESILEESDALSDMSVLWEDEETVQPFPPIIRASISILDSMLEDGSRLNVFVLPDKNHALMLFTVAKVLHNLIGGKVRHDYDPSRFIPGQKVKLGKAVAEFLYAGEYEGKQGVFLRLSDVKRYFCPIEILPVLQHTDTKKSLSKDKVFQTEKRSALEVMSGSGSDSALSVLESHKSHIEKSIACVGSVSLAKSRLNQLYLNGKKFQDIVLVAKTDYDGVIKNVSAGQFKGVPAVVLASDLFAANATAEVGHPFQSMIIDITNINQILNELDAVDEAIAWGIPILCLTDSADAFELTELQRRGFRIWRWDSLSLTKALTRSLNTATDRHIRNCRKQKIHYSDIEDQALSECMARLSRQRNVIKDQEGDIIRIYDQLSDLTFKAVRETVPFSSRQRMMAEEVIRNCREKKLQEKPYVSESMASDINRAADLLESAYSDTAIPKNEAIKDWLMNEGKGRRICIVIPDNEDSNRVRNYWNQFSLQKKLGCEIIVMHPSEYYSAELIRFDTTIIAGWFRREIMRKIIFSYTTENYVVFLYKCEKRWKNCEEHKWAATFRQSDTRNIIHDTLSKGRTQISVSRWDEDQRFRHEEDTTEDLNEFEQVLKENKYRQYTSGSTGSKVERVQAFPISYLGGYVAFYRTEHKLIQITNVLKGTTDKIRTLTPDRLEEGDFVILREADQDLIRELADEILHKENKDNLRTVAGKWREPLKIELMFSEPKDVYNKLEKAGCNKGWTTFNKWLTDEDMIAPQDKTDIKLIAHALENETLLELVDKVCDAAKEVRIAHNQAGVQLSKLLKDRIAIELKKHQIEDIFNVWEPIQFEIEGIGPVRILKIIDIETPVEVDASLTNRLLSE